MMIRRPLLHTPTPPLYLPQPPQLLLLLLCTLYPVSASLSHWATAFLLRSSRLSPPTATTTRAMRIHAAGLEGTLVRAARWGGREPITNRAENASKIRMKAAAEGIIILLDRLHHTKYKQLIPARVPWMERQFSHPFHPLLRPLIPPWLTNHWKLCIHGQPAAAEALTTTKRRLTRDGGFQIFFLLILLWWFCALWIVYWNIRIDWLELRRR